MNEIYKRAEFLFPQVVEYLTRPYDSYDADKWKEEFELVSGVNRFYEWFRTQPEIIEWEMKKQQVLSKLKSKKMEICYEEGNVA